MLTYPVFITLMVLSFLGLLLGAFYYTQPQKVVVRRIKKDYFDTARKDGEFRRWLDREIDTQVRKTKRLGLIMIILEAIWMVLVLGLWQKGAGS